MLRRLLTGIAFAILAVTIAHAADLQSNGVLGLFVAEESNGPLCSLRIRGLVGGSSLMVVRTTVQKVHRTAEVAIEVSLARAGGSGNFDVALNIDDIDQVVFGGDKAVVWRRENSKCLAGKHQ